MVIVWCIESNLWLALIRSPIVLHTGQHVLFPTHIVLMLVSRGRHYMAWLIMMLCKPIVSVAFYFLYIIDLKSKTCSRVDHLQINFCAPWAFQVRVKHKSYLWQRAGCEYYLIYNFFRSANLWSSLCRDCSSWLQYGQRYMAKLMILSSAYL